MQNNYNTPGKGITLLDEIFMEASQEKEFVVLEISVPGYEKEYGFNRELDDVGKRIADCLQKASIPGIKQTAVTGYKNAEIILELEHFVTPQVTLNRNRGNRYRDSIGEALKRCSSLFRNIRVEGAKNVNNRIETGHGPRYVDIRMTDTLTGKPVNIELKRGGSRYHSGQKKKDAAIASAGRGTTYVVRGQPARKRR